MSRVGFPTCVVPRQVRGGPDGPVVRLAFRYPALPNRNRRREPRFGNRTDVALHPLANQLRTRNRVCRHPLIGRRPVDSRVRANRKPAPVQRRRLAAIQVPTGWWDGNRARAFLHNLQRAFEYCP